MYIQHVEILYAFNSLLWIPVIVFFCLVTGLTHIFELDGGCEADTSIKSKVRSIFECARDCLCNPVCAAYNWAPADEDNSCELWIGSIVDVTSTQGATCYKKTMMAYGFHTSG